MTSRPAFPSDPPSNRPYTDSANHHQAVRILAMNISTPFRKFAAYSCILGLFALAVSSQAAQINVSNANDSGAGSLRAAIDTANATPAADTIVFTGSFSIPLNSELPGIRYPVNILGDAHLGPNPTGPGLVLDGHLVPRRRTGLSSRSPLVPDSGLHLLASAAGSTIRGISFLFWDNHGKRRAIRVDAADCGIYNCHFEYTTTQANVSSVYCIESMGERLRIGAPGTGMGNVFAAPVLIRSGSLVMENNLFGFAPDTGLPFDYVEYLTDLPANWLVLYSSAGAGSNHVGGPTPGQRNYFGRCQDVCIYGRGSTAIEGNWFGISPSGTAHPVNCGAVNLHAYEGETSPVRIGGTTRAHGNHIALSGETAIAFTSQAEAPAANWHTISNNVIGELPNGGLVGGTSGGIIITSKAHVLCADNVVRGALRPGIHIAGYAGSSWSDPAWPAFADLARNVVTQNSSASPMVVSSRADQTANVTNDALDADTGSNGLQNTPVLTSVSRPTAGSAIVSGTLHSHPSESFRIEFFSGAMTFTGPQAYLGSTTVTTDGAGNAAISHDLGNVASNQSICATATRLAATPGPQTGPFSNAVVLPSSGRFQFATGVLTGPEGSTRTLEIQRLGGSAGAVSVRIDVQPGGPLAGTDFSFSGTDAPDGTVNFAQGQTSRVITLNILQDDVDEMDTEILVLVLANPTGGATVSSTTKLVGLLDDDASPTVSINSATITEGNSGQAMLNFTASLSRPCDRVTSFTVIPPVGSGANPADPADFGSATATLVIPGTYLIQLPVLGDSSYEPDETFVQGASLRLSTSVLGTFETITATPGTGTILNDDAAPAQSFGFTSAEATPFENDGGLWVWVTRTSSSGGVSVDVTAEDLTAVRGDDYTVAPVTTLNFPDGVTSQIFFITFVDDIIPEDGSKFRLRLENPTFGTGIGTHPAMTVTIKDNDPLPVLSWSDVTLAEGNPGSPLEASCTFSLNIPSEVPVVVYLASRDNTTDAADYTPVSTSFEIPPGATSHTVFVPVSPDTDFEADEIFYLDILAASSCQITDTELKITIQNDDASFPVLAFGDMAKIIAENGDPAEIVITRTGQIDTACEFSINKSGGTAKPGEEYNALASVYFLPAGERELRIPLTPVNDSEHEPDKDLLLDIVPVDGISNVGTPASAKLTFLNDDRLLWRWLEVVQPDPEPVITGDSREYPETVTGYSEDMVFFVRNLGNQDVSALLYIDGADATQFSIVSPSSPVSIPPMVEWLPVTVRCSPTSPGGKSATLHFEGVVANHVQVTLQAEAITLSATTDSDGDGLNDLAEHQLRGLGFDRSMTQPDLVSTLFAGGNAAGLFTEGQLQALRPSAPLISKEPGSGQFKLTMELTKSTDLQHFAPAPMLPAGVTLNPQGNIEYRFTAPEPAMFFRVESGP